MHLFKRTNNTAAQHDNKGLIIGLTVGLLLACIILLGIILYRRKRRNKLGKEPKDISVKEEFIGQVKTAYKVTDGIYQFLKVKEDTKSGNYESSPTNKESVELLVKNDDTHSVELAYPAPVMNLKPVQNSYPNTVNEVVSIATINKLNENSPTAIETSVIAQETQSGSEQRTTLAQDLTSNIVSQVLKNNPNIEFPMPNKSNNQISNDQEKSDQKGTLAKGLANTLVLQAINSQNSDEHEQTNQSSTLAQDLATTLVSSAYKSQNSDEEKSNGNSPLAQDLTATLVSQAFKSQNAEEQEKTSGNGTLAQDLATTLVSQAFKSQNADGQEKTNENVTVAQDLFNNFKSSGLGDKVNISSVNKLFKKSKLKANNFMNNQGVKKD